MKGFCPQIERLRKHLGVEELKEIAEIIGFKAGTLSMWNNREKIPDNKIWEISQKVDCDPTWLRTGERPTGLLEFPRSATVRETSVDAPHITETGSQVYLGTISGVEAWLIQSFRDLNADAQQQVREYINGIWMEKNNRKK